MNITNGMKTYYRVDRRLFADPLDETATFTLWRNDNSFVSLEKATDYLTYAPQAGIFEYRIVEVTEKLVG